MTIVSLVPSLTEAIALTPGGKERLVGVTDWCTHPGDLQVERIGGTKNPDVARIRALRPAVVVANEEENRPQDLAQLRDTGARVIVTTVRSVEGALTELGAMLAALDLGSPKWLRDARQQWEFYGERSSTSTDTDATVGRGSGIKGAAQGTASVSPTARKRCVVMIWRKPWMAVGSDTFAGDVVRRLGYDNVLAHDPQRYPKVDLGGLPQHDVVILPDEPYEFSAEDGPQFFDAPCALVSGRLLTWYGPAMVQAPQLVSRALARATR